MTATFRNWRDLGLAGPTDFSSTSSEDFTREVDLQAKPALVTPKGMTPVMLEEALATAYRGLGFTESKMSALMSMMKNDVAGPVSHTYQTSKIAAAKLRAATSKTDVVVKYQLTDDEMTALADYAKEFRLVYRSPESHDHAMAAICRVIDHKLIAARLPPGLPVSDIGGNPLVYVRSGQTHVHVCGPVVDPKDQMRHMLRKAEARTLCSRPDTRDEVREMAQGFLDRNSDFVCDKKALDCSVRTPVITSVHVYDIPLVDWPTIMETKHAGIVEGCLLFSEEFLENKSGELAVSGARYEIDLEADEFRMGFRGSPAWWYKHKWSDYSAYAVDQLLYSGRGRVFSYKVIERRKDTLFFRIMRLEQSDPVVHRTVLRRPGVKMVVVKGFELSDQNRLDGRNLRRRDYTFPRNLWYEMVAQAAEDFERGVMDYTKMYAHYRTISVRQTINAVCVMGGEPVSPDELVPLVVHCCLAAAAQCMLGQRETRGITSVAMAQRARREESTMLKIGRAVLAVARGTVFLPLYPFKLLAEALESKHAGMLESWVMDWEPQVDLIEVDTKLLCSPTLVSALSAREVLDDSARQIAPHDFVHAVTTDKNLRTAFRELFSEGDVAQGKCTKLDNAVRSVAGGSEDESGEGTIQTEPTLPSYHTNEVRAQVSEEDTVLRAAAIREHIEEIVMMNRAVESTCADAYSKLCTMGQPNARVLKKHAENFRNPDLWRVVNGVVVESALKIGIGDFKYSAVYHPTPDEQTGSRVRAVYDDAWEGTDPDGVHRRREHKVLADRAFSGWVLVTDDLVVFNGPEIMESMRAALHVDHSYSVHVEQGPPGCGKTYSIVTQFKPGEDVVVCPVRESIEDTRAQIKNRHPQVVDLKLTARTIDSYLTNYRRGKNAQVSTDRLLVDECYMTHAGKIYAVAGLLGAQAVVAFGDPKQIPHIPRVQASKVHLKLRSQTDKQVWTTRRCPASAVAAWGGVYNWTVRSLSKKEGEMTMVHTTKGKTVPRGCTMMCMYQADKVELRRKYAAELGHIKILTAHEAEGKTYKDVWLHRFDSRRRSDKSSLFDQSPHVLVAMSRHTDSFVYCCPADLGDLPSQWIAKSKNPRRLAAAADVGSMGTSMEFL